MRARVTVKGRSPRTPAYVPVLLTGMLTTEGLDVIDSNQTRDAVRVLMSSADPLDALADLSVVHATVLDMMAEQVGRMRSEGFSGEAIAEALRTDAGERHSARGSALA